MSMLLTVLVRLYGAVISPIIHGIVPVRSGCRFSPTCSEYFLYSVRDHGARAGLRMGLSQFSRCHPFPFHFSAS